MNDFREYKNYLMHYGVKGMKWHDHVYQQDEPNPQAKSQRSMYDRVKVEKQISNYMKYLNDQGTLDKPEWILNEIAHRREEVAKYNNANNDAEASERQANIDLIKRLESYLKQNFGKSEMKRGNSSYFHAKHQPGKADTKR